MSTQVTLENVVLSFNDLFVPKKAQRNGRDVGEPKYSATLLLPEDFDWAVMDAAADEAAQKSFQENVQEHYVLPWFQPEKESYRQFEDQWALRTSTPEDKPPTVVGFDVKPLLDRTQIFSGCIVNVQVNLWAYEVDDIGVKCFLDIMQLADNSSELVKRMDGRKAASEVFKPIKGAPEATSRPGLGSRNRGSRGGGRGGNKDFLG